MVPTTLADAAKSTRHRRRTPAYCHYQWLMQCVRDIQYCGSSGAKTAVPIRAAQITLTEYTKQVARTAEPSNAHTAGLDDKSAMRSKPNCKHKAVEAAWPAIGRHFGACRLQAVQQTCTPSTQHSRCCCFGSEERGIVINVHECDAPVRVQSRLKMSSDDSGGASSNCLMHKE